MKTDPATEAAWRAVTCTDASNLDRDAIVALLGSIAAVRSACDAVEVHAVRRSRELNAAGASEPAESLLAEETGRSSKDAKEAAAREEACAAMPDLEAGLADGRMSAGHVDAAAAAHAKLKDEVAEQFAAHAEALVNRSEQIGVDAFERECRDLARHLTALNDRNAEVDELERQKAASSVKRWVDKTTGMHNTLISLDPIRDAKMWKVINNQIGRERQQRAADRAAAMSFAALQAQAVFTAITEMSAASKRPHNPTGNAKPADVRCRTASSDGTGEQREPIPMPAAAAPACGDAASATTSDAALRLPDVSILCDFDTLVTGIRSIGGICETDDGVPMPPETVRRHACDANLIPILLGSRGEVLDQGRKARTATAAQRNTLAAMHRSCAFPGCTIGFSDCRMHHVRWWWEHHGPTDIDNLLPLCERHHHLVHEGGWGLSLSSDVDRVATWTRPDGSRHHQGTTINRQPTNRQPLVDRAASASSKSASTQTAKSTVP